MKQILVELDDDLAARLDAVAPGRARKRSEFIRRALLKALCEIEEQAAAAAYGRLPDVGEPAFVAEDWDANSHYGRSNETGARKP